MSKNRIKNQAVSQKQGLAPRKKYLFYTTLFVALAVAGFFSAYLFSKIYGNDYSEIVGDSESKDKPQQDEPVEDENTDEPPADSNSATNPAESPNKSTENNNNNSSSSDTPPAYDYADYTIRITSAGVDGDYVYASAEISGLVNAGQTCSYSFSSKSSQGSSNILSNSPIRTNVSAVNGPSTASCKEGRIPKSRLLAGENKVVAEFRIDDRVVKSEPYTITVNK
jgi:hypothetical protein